LTAPAPAPTAPPTATASAPAAAKAVLALDRLTRSYGERIALHELSLRLERGKTLLILGANGAGKTTLLRVLAGLLRPHSGRVSVLGRELPREAPLLRGEVGLLAHDPLLYRDLSGRENLTFQARLHGGGAASRIDELLARAGVAERADEPVRTLSRGLVQRLAVCRCVLSDPALVLLDEPLANLDPAAAERVAPLIGAGAARFTDDGARRTRVLVSHDPGAALAEADLVLGLRNGAPALLAPADQVSGDELRALYR
jgi:heme ABC exporter ATP-binding subunit CcmA